jgi:hypothetical protein
VSGLIESGFAEVNRSRAGFVFRDEVFTSR